MFTPANEGSHSRLAPRGEDGNIFVQCVPNNGEDSGRSICYASCGNHRDNGEYQSEDNSDSESDNEDDGPPQLMNVSDSDSKLKSDDDEPDDKNVARVMSNEEVIYTIENGKCKLT